MSLKLSTYEEHLYDTYVSYMETMKVLEKTTIVSLKLHNGFEVIGTSACVKKEDFKKEIGEFFALREAINKLDELAGFHRQERLSNQEDEKEV